MKKFTGISGEELFKAVSASELQERVNQVVPPPTISKDPELLKKWSMLVPTLFGGISLYTSMVGSVSAILGIEPREHKAEAARSREQMEQLAKLLRGYVDILSLMRILDTMGSRADKEFKKEAQDAVRAIASIRARIKGYLDELKNVSFFEVYEKKDDFDPKADEHAWRDLARDPKLYAATREVVYYSELIKNFDGREALLKRIAKEGGAKSVDLDQDTKAFLDKIKNDVLEKGMDVEVKEHLKYAKLFRMLKVGFSKSVDLWAGEISLDNNLQRSKISRALRELYAMTRATEEELKKREQMARVALPTFFSVITLASTAVMTHRLVKGISRIRKNEEPDNVFDWLKVWSKDSNAFLGASLWALYVLMVAGSAYSVFELGSYSVKSYRAYKYRKKAGL